MRQLVSAFLGPLLLLACGPSIKYSVVSFDISPDGARIGFVGWKNNKANIFVKELGGGRATLQRTFRENVSDPAFSADGSTLAYADFRDGSWNIYTIGAQAGSAIQQITTSVEPVISPDGQQIAFVAAASGRDIPTNLDVFLVRVDGTGLTQLTFHPGHDLSARWSPDGQAIYFLSQRGSEKGEFNIWRMDLR